MIAGLLAFAPLAEALVEAPVLAPSTADSTVGIDVTITCTTPGAQIRYTLNGADPILHDQPIASGGSIRISRNAVLKVRAWAGTEASPVVTEDYRITGAVANGYQHGLALSVAGRVWSWGEQGSGRLGNGSTAPADVITPGRVLLPPGNFELGAIIAAGFDHSLVVDQSRQIWAFGENGSGQLGNNTTTDSALPVRVLKSATAGDFLGAVTGADAGQNFSLALLEDGTPVTWGSQSSGRLGNGVNSSSSRKYAEPVENGSDPAYPDLTGIRQISAGHGHGLAREANAAEVEAATGRVWVWGSNGSGQLGRGTTSPLTRAQPMLLNATTELTDALDVSGGGSHSAVVRWKANDPDLDGTVWSCGNQSDGRLGNGVTTSGDVTYPVKAIKVGGAPLTGIRQVSAGPSHTLALDADGHVWAWGDNSYGQLGDGTTADNGHARLVLGANGTGTLGNIVMVTAGGESTNGRSMALAGDGTIWVWGRNNEGQLGNGQIAGATILPVAHAQNHVAEGAPAVSLSFDITTPVEQGEVELVASPTHSGPGGLTAINRIELFLNGTLVETLAGGDWETTIDDLNGGAYHGFAVAFDVNGLVAMSQPISFEIALHPDNDRDGDGLTNGREALLGTNPYDKDTDWDGMEDGWEDYHNLPAWDGQLSNAANTGALDDPDGDGRNNLAEFSAGIIPWSPNERIYITGNPLRVFWFGTAGTAYALMWSTDLQNWSPTGYYREGQNEEVFVPLTDIFDVVPPSAFFRLYYSPSVDPDDWDGDGIPNLSEINLHGTDPLVADVISIELDGSTYTTGQAALNIPYRQGELTAEVPMNLPAPLDGLGEWTFSSDAGATWAPVIPAGGLLTLPTGDDLIVRYHHAGELLFEVDITWTLIAPSTRQTALTQFTIRNTGHSISTAKAPLGAWHLAGPGGTGSLKLKKSAVTGCYSVDIGIEVQPGSGFDPTDYSYRIFSAFKLPQEMPKGGSTGGSQEAPRPFSPIPDGIETLPLPNLQNPFPVNGGVTQEINPIQYGEPPYIIQIIPTPTPEEDFTADNSPVYAEASTEGYSSCSSCSSCITPQVSLQDTPLTLSLGGTDGYDETDGDPEDPQNPEPRFDACEADGELTFNIPSLYDPSASAVTNPGIAGLGLLAPRGAYNVTMVAGLPTRITGQREFVIEPWTGRSDPAAFKVTGYAIPADTSSKYITMTVELVDLNGVPTLEVKEVQGEATAPRTHHFSKESNGATRTAVLRSHNGARDIRREFTPTGPTTWNERRIAKESPTSGGGTVAVHDENLKFRTLSTGASRVEERTIDPGNRALKTRNFFYEASQNSGGATSSNIGTGRLKKMEKYDGLTLTATYSSGKQEVTTPYAGNPQGTKTTTEAALGSFQSVGTAIGPQSSGTGGTTIGILKFSTFSADGASTSSSAPEGQEWAGSSITVGQGGKATVRDYLPRTHATAPGRISRIRERSGRLTTIAYTYSGGTRTIVEESGEPDASGLVVVKGERVTTTSTNCQRMLSEETVGFDDLAEKENPVFLSGRYAGPEDFDDLGRSLFVHYNTYPSEDLESFTYSCCGVHTHTDRRGKIFTYTHDDLGRIKTTTVKRSAAGPATVFATDRTGLTVTRTRDGVVMSSTTSNLAGEVISSSTADENGDLQPEITLQGYTYSATGTRVDVAGPLGTTRFTITHPDGRTAVVGGNSVPDRVMQYETGTGGYHEVVTEIRLRDPYDGDLANENEWVKSAYDIEGRKVAAWHAGAPADKALWNYHPVTGLLTSSSDADGIATTYEYHPDGSLHHVAREISDNRHRVTTREYGYVKDDLQGGVARGSRFEETYLQTSIGPVTGLDPVTTTWSRGDGYASRTASAATGTTLSYESIPTTANRTAGAWTSVGVAADDTRIVATYADGLLTTSANQDSASAVVSSVSYAYDSIGRLLSMTDSRTGTITHDENDDLVPEMTASGNVLYTEEPGNRVSRTTYDALGRPVQTTLPDGTTTHTGYYPTGLVRAVWGSQTYPQRYTYDEQGRRTGLATWRNNPPPADPGTTLAEANTIWTYDAAGRNYIKRDAQFRTVFYEYTSAGRLALRRWSRSLAGTVTPTLETRIKSTYVYDKGLLESVTYNDSTPAVDYTHDGYGRVATVTQQGNQWDYQYDPDTWLLNRERVSYDLDNDANPELERVIHHDHDATAGARPQAFRLGIDSNGSPETLELIEHEVGYFHDPAGRLDGIDATGLPGSPSSSSGHAFHYQYLDDSYSLIDKVLGPVHNVVNHWEPTRDVLDWKDNRDTLNVTQAKFDYGVNAIGQRFSGLESGTHLVGPGLRDWGYNSRGELESESTGSAYDRGYRYDAIGNRKNTSIGTTDPAQAPAADLGTYRATAPANNIPGALGANSLNQYGEVIIPGAAAVPVVHDLDGNMTSGPLPAAPGQASTLKWDAENRLIETQVGTAGPLVRYHYDPFGRRIAKTVGTSTTPELYLYDGWNLVAKYTGDLAADSATLDTTYTWGLDLSGSLQGAGGVGGLLAIHEQAGNGSAKAGQVIYPAYDGNGNIVRLFNSGGGTVASYAYDGFGNRLNPGASDIDASGYADEQEFGFSTKFRDSETGLIYYGYRYYDPVTGRWPSRDPIEEAGGVNLYGFVGNNGVNQIDLLGLISPGHNGPPGDGGETGKHIIESVRKILDWLKSTEPLPWTQEIDFTCTGTGIDAYDRHIVGDPYRDPNLAANQLGAWISELAASGSITLVEFYQVQALLYHLREARKYCCAGTRPSTGIPDIDKALDEVLDGTPRPNVRDPKPYANDPFKPSNPSKPGLPPTPQKGTLLPDYDLAGRKITYTEHTVNPRPANGGLDGKRIITGDDGSIWITLDHMKTWIRMQ